MKSLLMSSLTASFASAVPLKGYLTKENIPSSGKDWVTLDNGVEFQPGEDVDPRLQHVRKLWGSNGQSDNPAFVDGKETYYDEYAQAWRLLGLYIDCDHCDAGMSEAECLQAGQEPVCQRYLLWAAYVDLDYEGNGVGEYMYYDRNRKKWNNAACKASSSSRCVKMDCHEPNSHFKLLGIFKEPEYATMLQQIVNYQGSCVWTSDEYASASAVINVWPEGCTQANNGLYYDAKPLSGGSMTIGLYNDAYCTEEYTGSITVAETVGQAANDDDNAMQLTFKSNEAWNDAFDAFTICQPCKVSNLVSIINKGGDATTCENNENNAVNQCMQFQGNTNMYTASYHDLMAAEEQGTVGSVNVASVKYGVSENQKNDKWKKNLLSALFMIASFFLFLYAFYRLQSDMDQSDMDEPFVRESRSSRNRR